LAGQGFVEPSARPACRSFGRPEKNSTGSFAPRHLREKVNGEMTLEWLRDEKVILQRSTVENPIFPEGVVLIMTAGEDTRATSPRTTSTPARCRECST